MRQAKDRGKLAAQFAKYLPKQQAKRTHSRLDIAQSKMVYASEFMASKRLEFKPDDRKGYSKKAFVTSHSGHMRYKYRP